LRSLTVTPALYRSDNHLFTMLSEFRQKAGPPGLASGCELDLGMTFAGPSLIDRHGFSREGRASKRAAATRARQGKPQGRQVRSAMSRISVVAQGCLLNWRMKAPDATRFMSNSRQIGFSIAGTALVVCAAFELFRPVDAVWVALPPGPIASDRAALSSADESRAARRFRHAFDDPAQPLFSRIAAISPALSSLPLAAEPDESRETVVRGTVQEMPESASPKDMPQPANHPDTSASISFAGIWAPSASACSPKSNSQLLPAVINEEGAWAGEVSCRFRRQRQAGNTAIFSSTCSNGRQKWTANVRLAVAGDRLIWSSERGSQTYVRCAPRILEARAGI
jgi:hypothetical protein